MAENKTYENLKKIYDKELNDDTTIFISLNS